MVVIQQSCVDNGHSKKQSGSGISKNSADDFSSRFLATQECGVSVKERKRKAVAQPVRKRQPRRGKESIPISELQDFLAESLIGAEDIGNTMHGPLWLTGAAGSVKNKSRVLVTARREAGGRLSRSLVYEPF